MAKLTQAEVRAKADEYAALSKKIEKSEAARDAEMQPFVEKHQRAIKGIVDHHEPRIQKMRDQRDALQTEVLGWLNGVGKPLVLEGENATAVVESKPGSRVIDVQKFLKKAKDKGSAMWECLSVAVAKAEKLLGEKTISEISRKDSKLVASLKLK